MAKFRYVGPEGLHYSSLQHVVGDVLDALRVPVPGETYDLVEVAPHENDPEGTPSLPAPLDGNWKPVGAEAKEAVKAALVEATPDPEPATS